ncbi:MAG TPA: SDR family NAD(P)-dependent oxidoreductase [Candidatus Nitrosopolaris sp.]|nr:SDR family NAD(P)-dependent oxidoreductase [Candidatus Nitrosopolaris sp.]
MRLRGRVALVTGAASGIGLGIALLFIKEGAKVVFSDINESGKAAADAAGENALFIQCDISDTESVKILVAKTLDAFGTIDILINNAGIVRQNPISKTSDEEWNAVINTNLKGPFLLIREVLPTFEKNGQGKIVSTASIAGIIGYENLSPYCASKGGIIAMTRALALEFAPKKINVNCICPGAIKTGMTKMIEENETILKQTLMVIPAGRMGDPIDIANAALYLASDESDYVTGMSLVVDGGWSVR